MLLSNPIHHIFIQISDILRQLSEAEYTQQSKILFNATIGQHVRHIIELFQALENGYAEGTVNYEKRKRDYRIETNKNLAISLLKDIRQSLDRPNKEIILVAEDYGEEMEPVSIITNYYREIAYNLEHTIHHMALIRVGVNEVSNILLPDEFGVAYSTIKYRQQCAQ
jgi:adenosyl cobinamide kinase/adenosyl cobinamide phosphate guanylyltransferase